MSPVNWEAALLSSPLLTTYSLASHPQNVPSKSSMVFSSLATDRSANSARVSACQTEVNQLVQRTTEAQGHQVSHPPHLSPAKLRPAHPAGHPDMATHLFEFISQDLDLFFVFILFLRVLWKRKGVSSQQP